MAHVSQQQRRAHTAIYNLMTRVNNRDRGSEASDNILKKTVWELCKQMHLGDDIAARKQYKNIVSQCFGEEVI